MNDIIPSNDQPTIESAFYKTTEQAAILRTKITQKLRGTLWPNVRDFKQYFDMLYLMTHFRPGLNPNTVAAVKAWSKQIQTDDKLAIMAGIDLFEEYSIELFNNKIIEIRT